MLYVRIFRTNVVFSSYLYVEKTMFVRKIRTYKMLMKLTPWQSQNVAEQTRHCDERDVNVTMCDTGDECKCGEDSKF